MADLEKCSGQDGGTTGEEQTIKSGYINVDGGKLFYEMSGKGKTIVLVHDGILHRETYDDQFLVLAKDYRVIRYDRRGYGKSPKPDKPFSNIEDLNSLFEQLNIDQACLIGCSAGGGLCIDFTLEYPDKVTSLVLVGSVVGGFDYTQHLFTRGGHWTDDDKSSLEKMIHYWAVKDPYEIAPENTEVKERVKRLLTENPQDMDFEKSQLAKRPEKQALEHLSEIKIPALIIAGEHDVPDVHALAGAIQAGIPGAKRIIINGGGHLIHMERPEEFNKCVLDFFKSINY